jgi:hypothetical protein
MQVGRMVLYAGFYKHAYDNSKEARNFGHMSFCVSISPLNMGNSFARFAV